MHRKTTLYGVLSAICATLSTVGDLAPPWSWLVKLVGAAGLAMLGHSAADRPKKP